MDLHNLVTVEYNVTYNQSKLEQVLKQLQLKLTKFDQSIQNINQQCQKFQQIQTKTQQKISKLKQFTIDNLRQTVNEISFMKNGLINYLGDQWIKDQQNMPIASKSQLSTIFQSRLTAFNQETNKLHRKVSIIQQELTANTNFQKEQNQAINNTINEHKKQINKVRESIKNEISEKFTEFQKEFEDKNMKQILMKAQMQSDLSAQLMKQQGEMSKNNLMKAMKQLKHHSINKKVFDVNQLQNSKEEQQGMKLKKKNKRFSNQENFKISQKSIESQQNENDSGQIEEQEKNKEKGQLTMAQIEQQSMQHAINSLREELKLMLDSQMLQFRSCLEALNARYDKADSSITFLTNTGKQHKNSIIQIESKISDLKNQIENNKTALYETNQKHNQSQARIIENEQKTLQIQNNITTLTNQFKAYTAEAEQSQSYMKFKENQNMTLMNSNRYRNSLPNYMSSPNLKEDNIIVQRLNNLTEKIAKIQDKIKNGQQGSQRTLPRLNSSSHLNTKGSSMPTVDLLRKDLQKSNEQINKTNERLQTLKKNLKELEAAHSVIPAKIQKLQVQVRNVNQIQQDRLLQLIKELINRVLTDPFNNNFTNTLKRQIQIKFLEIKHQYSSIWKDIDAKVTDRAETTQLLKLKENVQNQNLEIKSLVNKKADSDDLKKGIKYLDGKIKQVYSYLKLKETQQNSPQGRKYYMGKK